MSELRRVLREIVLSDVVKRRERQDRQGSIADAAKLSAGEAIGSIAVALGSAARCAIERNPEGYREALVWLAAVVVGIIEEHDRREAKARREA